MTKKRQGLTPQQKIELIVGFANKHHADIEARANAGDQTCIKIVGTVLRMKQNPQEVGNLAILAHLLDLYKDQIGDKSKPFITGVKLKENDRD